MLLNALIVKTSHAMQQVKKHTNKGNKISASGNTRYKVPIPEGCGSTTSIHPKSKNPQILITINTQFIIPMFLIALL